MNVIVVFTIAGGGNREGHAGTHVPFLQLPLHVSGASLQEFVGFGLKLIAPPPSLQPGGSGSGQPNWKSISVQVKPVVVGNTEPEGIIAHPTAAWKDHTVFHAAIE